MVDEVGQFDFDDFDLRFNQRQQLVDESQNGKVGVKLA